VLVANRAVEGGSECLVTGPALAPLANVGLVVAVLVR